MSERLSGSCLCGKVRFTAVPNADEMGVCHCAMCRKWTGGTYMAVACGTSVEFDGRGAPGRFQSFGPGEAGFFKEWGAELA